MADQKSIFNDPNYYQWAMNKWGGSNAWMGGWSEIRKTQDDRANQCCEGKGVDFNVSDHSDVCKEAAMLLRSLAFELPSLRVAQAYHTPNPVLQGTGLADQVEYVRLVKDTALALARQMNTLADRLDGTVSKRINAMIGCNAISVDEARKVLGGSLNPDYIQIRYLLASELAPLRDWFYERLRQSNWERPNPDCSWRELLEHLAADVRGCGVCYVWQSGNEIWGLIPARTFIDGPAQRVFYYPNSTADYTNSVAIPLADVQWIKRRGAQDITCSQDARVETAPPSPEPAPSTPADEPIQVDAAGICPQGHHKLDGRCLRDYCHCACAKCKKDCGEV